VLVFNNIFVNVDILFFLLHFHIFLIPKEDRQLSTAEKDEAKSKVQDEVQLNEDDVQHTNVAAPGSGNGMILIKDMFFVTFFLLCICLKYSLLNFITGLSYFYVVPPINN